MYYERKVGHTNRYIDSDFNKKLFFSKDRKIRGTNEIQDSKGENWECVCYETQCEAHIAFKSWLSVL